MLIGVRIPASQLDLPKYGNVSSLCRTSFNRAGKLQQFSFLSPTELRFRMTFHESLSRSNNNSSETDELIFANSEKSLDLPRRMHSFQKRLASV